MIHFVGAGSGAVDLITVRGKALIEAADVIIYAGSLINPELLQFARPGAELHDSAKMDLEQIVSTMVSAEKRGLATVRLVTGDPCLFGAIREQMDELDARGIAYDDVPGVSSLCGAAAALGTEYTMPGGSQSVIITRMAGRTPVPEAEDIAELAAHGCTMVVFLSAGMLEGLQAKLLAGAYTTDTPAAIVYRATWPDQKVVRCTVGSLADAAHGEGIDRMALVCVGDFLDGRPTDSSGGIRSCLYDPTFQTGFRDASASTTPADPKEMA